MGFKEFFPCSFIIPLWCGFYNMFLSTLLTVVSEMWYPTFLNAP